MASNGSFYQNGLPISTAETGLGNVSTGAPVANKASSSFYLSGSVYTSAAYATEITTFAGALAVANNLSDLGNLGTALTNLGLQNVTNTSDINKPVSTAQATADALVASNAAAATALKANIASPALTGTPSAPTAAALTNNTQVATTAYADSAVSTLSGTVTTALGLKAPLASPALTGTPTAPTATAGTNTTQLATTAYADAINTLRIAAEALKAPLASPALTGVPTAPTAAALNNSTQLATTAYADAAVSTLSGTTTTSLALKAPLASPALTGTPTAPTATVGTNTTQLATTAFVLANGAAAGVSSIAGNTGAFTLGSGLTNATNVLKLTVGQLPGAPSNTAATAGNIGEIISSSVVSGSAVALTTATPANVTSISLTAGVWDVDGLAYFTGASGTVGIYQCSSISHTSATLNLTVGNYNIVPNYGSGPFGATTGNASGLGVFSPTTRILLASTTTIYLVVQAAFSASTQSAFGLLRGTRVL